MPLQIRNSVFEVLSHVLESTKNTPNPIIECRPNEKHILDILRQQQKASKAQIARMTDLTAVAVGSLIKSLEQKGLVKQVGKVQGDMGQPATMFSISGDGAYSFGVSINRGHFELVLMNLLGKVVASRKHEAVLPSPALVFETVSKDINELLAESSENVRSRIIGIGVAQPSNIGSQQKQVDSWQAWASFDIASQLADAFSLAVISQNDVNAAAMGEFIYGNASKSESFLYLFLGGALARSLGSAVYLNGQCWAGAKGNAGDIALAPVASGSTSRFVSRCSLNSLVDAYIDAGNSVGSHEDLIQLLEAQPDVFDTWSEKWTANFMWFVGCAQALLDFPEFIFDCEEIVEPIVDVLIEKLIQEGPSNLVAGLTMPKITKGSFRGHAAAIGAASLPIDSAFNPNRAHLSKVG